MDVSSLIYAPKKEETLQRLILILTIFMAPPGLANVWNQLDGVYAVTSSSVINQAEHLPDNSHYRFTLRGDSAKDLYLAMPATPSIDSCTGATAKNIQQMQCLFFNNEKYYECHFSIDIARQKIEYGVPC